MPRGYDIAWLPTSEPSLFQAELLGELRSCAMQTSAAVVAEATPRSPRITAAQVPRWMSHDDGRGRIVELIQLAKDWASFPALREAMIQEPPRSHRWHHRFTRRRRDLARIAAVVHALCDRDRHPIPSWVWQWRSDKPIGLCGGRVMQDTPYERSLRASAPEACSYHDVWFDHASIENIAVHRMPATPSGSRHESVEAQ